MSELDGLCGELKRCWEGSTYEEIYGCRDRVLRMLDNYFTLYPATTNHQGTESDPA